VFLQTLGLNTAQMDSEYAAYLDSRFRKIALHVNPPAAQASPVPSAAGKPDKNALIRKLETAPDDFWANLQLGILLRNEGANLEAESLLKKAQQLFPEYVEAGNPYQILGRCTLSRNVMRMRWPSSMRGLRGMETRRTPFKGREIYRRRAEWIQRPTAASRGLH